MGKTRKRKKPSLNEEIKLWKKGFDFVIGVDEVGRGAFAGPVTVGAVVFDKDTTYPNSILSEVNDSKLLNPSLRRVLSLEIKKQALYWSIVSVAVSKINKLGIGKATQMAFRKAISEIIQSIGHSSKRSQIQSGTWRSAFRISPSPLPSPLEGEGADEGARLLERGGKGEGTSQNDGAFLLVDGFHIRYVKAIGLKNQKAIIKGDQKSITIAAASIIAKVHRDSLMTKLHDKFPVYNFAKNKGYGTKEHQKAILKNGLSEIHRTSFSLEKFIHV